jgi:hypothetical protein
VQPGYGSRNAVSRTASVLELSAPKFSQGLHAQAHSQDGPSAPIPFNYLHERARFLG